MLTDSIIRAAKADSRPQKLFDEKGLFLLIKPGPAGGRLWRFKYRFPKSGPDKVGKLLALGSYPEVSLKQARDKRDEARRLLADGVDPAEKRREAALSLAAPKSCRALKDVALEWWAARSESERWGLTMQSR